MRDKKRKSWMQLTKREKELFDWVDLQDGETMSEWWDVYCEACDEEGSDPLDMELICSPTR